MSQWIPAHNEPFGEMVQIGGVRVYDLNESIVAAKYPMQTEINPFDDRLTATLIKLAQCDMGTGHDNWLCGIRVAFDISLTVKCLVEEERYHFADIVSSNSTMHRITKFDLDSAYCKYVDSAMIGCMKDLVHEYNCNPTPENLLRVLYSNPCGFTYTMRINTNYRQLKTMYAQRKNHRLPEWQEFCRWIETLPHAELIIGRQEGA